MFNSLYRKYRPKLFSEMAGQNHVKVALQYQIKQNAVSHAYLFCGPRAVGKTTSARLLAKAMNCLKRKDGEFEPCNECDSCKEIMQNHCLDVIEIDAASHTGVDHVREHIIANARVSPSKYTYKVFIIDEVHMLSISAFNALLKMLEEPPSNVIFILATTEIHKVPQTIISRCQRFDFQRIATDEIVKKLKDILHHENVFCDEDVLFRIAQRSEGCLRDAESLLGQILSLGLKQEDKKITLELAQLVIPRSYQEFVIAFFKSCVKKDAKQGLDIIDQLIKSGANFSEFFQEYIEFLRFTMVYHITKKVDDLSHYMMADQLKEVLLIADEVSVSEIVYFIEIALKRRQDIKVSPLPQLPLELALMESTMQQIKESFGHIKSPSFTANPSVTKSSFSSTKTTSQNPPVVNQAIRTNKEEIKEKEMVKEEKSYPKGDVSLEEIKQNWSAILSKSEEINHSLPFILKVSQPTQVDKNTVVITFKYPLHFEKSKENQTHKHINNIVKDVLNKDVQVTTNLDESLDLSMASDTKTDNESFSSQVNDALEVFGGTLVEGN